MLVPRGNLLEKGEHCNIDRGVPSTVTIIFFICNYILIYARYTLNRIMIEEKAFKDEWRL
jgi:hypothetical protein